MLFLFLASCSPIHMPATPSAPSEDTVIAPKNDDHDLVVAYSMGRFVGMPYTEDHKRTYSFPQSEETPGMLEVHQTLVYDTYGNGYMDYAVEISVNPGIECPGCYLEMARDDDLDTIVDYAGDGGWDEESRMPIYDERNVDARRQDTFNSIINYYAGQIRSDMK